MYRNGSIKSYSTVERQRKKRAGMLAYAFYDNDNRIIRYAETLISRGFDVDVFCLGRKGQPRQELVNGVRVFRIQRRQRDERNKFSYLFRILRFALTSSLAIGARTFSGRYKLVHVHSVPDFEVFAAWLPKLLGARIILDIHDIVPELYAEKFGIANDAFAFRLLLLAERLSTAFADHVIAANHLWWQTLCSRAVDPGKCTAIPNYIDRTVFTRPRRVAGDARPRLVYAGSLQFHQGLDLAVRAIANLRTRFPNIRLHIYGEGVAKESLVDLVRSMKLGENVIFKEPVPYRSIPSILEGATLGVVPKRADGFANQAFSTKILECMSQAVPVIVARTAIDAYYYPESTVRFFTPGDARSLAKAIDELLSNPAECRRLARCGYRFATRNSWQMKQHVYLDLVHRLLEQPACDLSTKTAFEKSGAVQPTGVVE